MQFNVRAVLESDREWIRQLIIDRWGAELVVAHGVVYYPHKLHGFVATTSTTERVGLATFVIEGKSCELVTLDSLCMGCGVGTALVQAVIQEGSNSGCIKIWCITTNDNRPALRFYQNRGFSILTVHKDAIERSRVLKPTIPLVGIDGIPINDEIELGLLLPTTPCK
jgi:GNAT superfamily N-acetyltransferase